MASRAGALDRRGAGAFAIGVWARAILIGALTFAAFVAAGRHLYATGLIFAAVAALVGLDLARSAGAADRLLAQFVDGLIAEGDDRPRVATGVGHLAAAIERALGGLAARRVESQQRADFTAALADNVLAALLVVDEDGEVVMANRAARQLLGEVAGPLGRIGGLPAESRQTLNDLAPGARDIVRLADNRALLASMTAFSIPGGQPLRLIALQTLSGDLDAVVVKAWQDLARVLAHEMMNSLTPICSLSDSIAARLRVSGEGSTAGVAEAVEVIARRSAGLMNFVERYRKLCDLPPAARSAIAMAPFVARLDQLMAPLMREAGIDYASAVSPPDLGIDADPDLLEQAVINLLKNALDAVAGRDGPMIRLSCRRENGQVLLSVEDNGPGLADDDPEAAFTPFFTTKLGGSGIGLTLARQIALAHGGRLDYARRPAGGACFTILLPCAGQGGASGER
jgi:two-component system nitrogen regulation sensor histidine kinase NtrY